MFFRGGMWEIDVCFLVEIAAGEKYMIMLEEIKEGRDYSLDR